MIDVPENVIKIDLAAVAANLGSVRARLAPEVGIMALVKADAYGHGARVVARRLTEEGVAALAVARVPEAVDLRRAGIPGPIFVLGGFWPEEVEALLDHDLTPVVASIEMAQSLARTANDRRTRATAVLKIDTGMGRLGLFWDRADDFLAAIKQLAGIRIIGLTTHLAQADKADKSFTLTQAERFAKVADLARTVGYELSANNLANSAAVADLPLLGPHLARPGIVLYGLYPSDEVDQGLDLTPAMTFVSRIMQVKDVPAGTGVSYHRTWIAPETTRLAAVPVGYCHGYPRLLSGRARMLVNGASAPVRGRVCMNTTMIDVSQAGDVKPGDEVVLLGRQGDQTITADELAAQAQTINYEMVCLLGCLNRRVYV